MDMTIAVIELKRGLAAVNACIDEDRNNPITGYMVLTAEERLCSLRGRTWQREVEVDLHAKVSVPAKWAVPSKVITSIVDGLPPDGSLSIKLDGRQLLLTCGKSRYRCSLLPAEDFPDPMPSVEDAAHLSILNLDLVGLLRAAVYATTYQADRAFADGVFLHNAGGKLAAVAVDGNRLGYRELDDVGMEAEVARAVNGGAVIPSDSVETISTLLSGETGTADVSFGKSALGVTIDGLRFSTLLLNCEYPPYKRVIPQDKEIAATVDRNVLLGAAERALDVVTSERLSKNQLPTGRFEVSAQGMTLRCGPAETPSVYEEIDADCTFPTTFTANLAWICEMLKQWPVDARINMHQSDAGKPILFTSGSVPGMLHVVMPTLPKGGE